METPKLIDLIHGIVPQGWNSVFNRQPPRTGIYQTIRQVGLARPVIVTDQKNRFIRKPKAEMWQTGNEITVLAWRR